MTMNANADNMIAKTVNAISNLSGGQRRRNNVLKLNNKTNIQETKTMTANTIFSRFARVATGLFALAGLVTMAHPAANAQATILSVTDPYHATGLTSRQTVVQFQVFNKGTGYLPSVQVQAVLLAKGSPAASLVITSSAVSLSAHQQKTLSIPVPQTAANGVSLLNRELVGTALVIDGNNVDDIVSVDFVDELPTANLQVTNVVVTSNSNGAPVLTVTITNNGTWASDSTATSANKLSAELYRYEDGKTPPDVTLSGYVEGLGVGAPKNYTFTFAALAGMQYQGQVWIDQSTWSIN
jgi:hypothetical protein